MGSRKGEQGGVGENEMHVLLNFEAGSISVSFWTWWFDKMQGPELIDY